MADVAENSKSGKAQDAETPALQEDSSADKAASRLTAEACFLAQQTPGTGFYSREQWAELAAKELHKVSEQGSLDPAVTDALKKFGAKVEQKDFIPSEDVARYFKDLTGMKSTTITLDPNGKPDVASCPNAAAKKVEMTIQPAANGTDVKVKLEEASGQLPKEIGVNIHEGWVTGTKTINPDGSEVWTNLNRDGSIWNKQEFNRETGFSRDTSYERGEQGKLRKDRTPREVYTRNPDGSRENVFMHNGVVREKQNINADKSGQIEKFEDGKLKERFVYNSSERLVDYKTFDKDGNPLRLDSITGYYSEKGKEMLTRFGKAMDDLSLKMEAEKINRRMPLPR